MHHQIDLACFLAEGAQMRVEHARAIPALACLIAPQVPRSLSHAAGLGDNAVRHIAGTYPRWPIGVGRTGAGFLIAQTDCAGGLRREVGD
jgi:hypothetical protein